MTSDRICPECGLDLISHMVGCHPPSRQEQRETIERLRASLTATQAKVGDCERERDEAREMSNVYNEAWTRAANENGMLRDRLGIDPMADLDDESASDGEKARKERDQAHARVGELERELEVLRPRARIARWNIEKDGDALVICDGMHEKSEACAAHAVRYVPEAKLREAEGRVVARITPKLVLEAAESTLAYSSEDGCTVIQDEQEAGWIADAIRAALGEGRGDESTSLLSVRRMDHGHHGDHGGSVIHVPMPIGLEEAQDEES